MNHALLKCKKVLKKFIVLSQWSVCILFCSESFGQDSLTYLIIQKLNAFRTEFLKDTQTILRISAIANKLKDNMANKTPMEIMSDIIYYKTYSNYDEERFRKYLHDELINAYDKHNFNDDDINFLNNNAEFFFLIGNDIFDQDYPFKLNPKAYILDEVRACKFSKNEKILEIGSGEGSFGFILNLIYEANEYSFNELNQLAFPAITNKCNKLKKLFPHSIYNVITGTTKETGYLGQADKIIIRNSFHHFSEKEFMLKNIYETLKEDGTLIIIEIFKSKNIKNQHLQGDIACMLHMKGQKFYTLLKAHGFELISNQVAGARNILTYKKLQ